MHILVGANKMGLLSIIPIGTNTILTALIVAQQISVLPTNVIGLVAILGAILFNGVVAIATLLVAQRTHKVANSRLSETIDKVDKLTAMNTEITRQLDRSQQAQADTATAAAARPASEVVPQ